MSAAVYGRLFIPRRYEAAATLVIIKPKLSSELKPSTLTVQGYQQLLESDAVLAETGRRLIEQGLLKEDAVLRAGGGLKTHIFVSEHREDRVLAPILQVSARAKSPDRAAAIANTWATVFLERIQTLTRGTTSAAVQFIEREYPRARERLAQGEVRRATILTEFQQQVDETTAHWEETLATFQNETAQLTAAFSQETRSLIGAFEKKTAQHKADFERETAAQEAAMTNETGQLKATLQNETTDLVAAAQAEVRLVTETFVSQRNLQTRKEQLEAAERVWQAPGRPSPSQHAAPRGTALPRRCPPAVGSHPALSDGPESHDRRCCVADAGPSQRQRR